MGQSLSSHLRQLENRWEHFTLEITVYDTKCSLKVPIISQSKTVIDYLRPSKSTDTWLEQQQRTRQPWLFHPSPENRHCICLWSNNEHTYSTAMSQTPFWSRNICGHMIFAKTGRHLCILSRQTGPLHQDSSSETPWCNISRHNLLSWDCWSRSCRQCRRRIVERLLRRQESHTIGLQEWKTPSCLELSFSQWIR